MNISPERLEEFKRIFKKEYNHEFKDDTEAREAANNLIEYFEILCEIAQEDRCRKQKLKKYPKGFPIDTDGTYSCWVCSTSINSSNGWYDKYGLKCLNCQKATENRTLPPIIFKDRDSWFTSWKLERDCGLHSATIRKLVREGTLKARVVPYDDGRPYFYVFLVNENIEFLKQASPN